MLIADDIVGLPCGGREVNMIEYAHTWKITRGDRGIRVSRLKTQSMDCAFEQSE